MPACTATERAYLDSILNNTFNTALIPTIKYESVPEQLKTRLVKVANSKAKITAKWEALLLELTDLGFDKRDIENVVAQVESDTAALSESSEPNA